MFLFLTIGFYLINLIWCSTLGTVPEAYNTDIQTLLVTHAVLRDTGKKRHPWPVMRCVHWENAVQDSFASCQQAISWTSHSVIICWNSFMWVCIQWIRSTCLILVEHQMCAAFTSLSGKFLHKLGRLHYNLRCAFK